MYSEANTHTRRLKYCYIETGGKQITQSELRRALDGAGLNEVVVKDFYCSDYYAGATLLEPIAWFTE